METNPNRGAALFEEGENFVVLDLEWNQSSYAPNPRMPHEIIEIGACRLMPSGSVSETFSRMIRPRLYRRLDKHIRQVTGITQEELAQGDPFEEVYADFIDWCGENAQLVTWGRDDYPVLKRNAAFFRVPLPFTPPLDAQMIYGFARHGDIHRQMNLHAAMEELGVTLEVPAHRAVYDAEATCSLLPGIGEMVAALDAAKQAVLVAAMDEERRIADSVQYTRATPFTLQSDALKSHALMRTACPVCGERTRFDTPWFDGGREKYEAILVCAEHGLLRGQMHFKRDAAGRLTLLRRTYPATRQEAEKIREGYRLYQMIPPQKRRRRLSYVPEN